MTISAPIAVVNESSLPDATVQIAAAAVQHQITYDFAPSWNRNGTVTFVAKGAVIPAAHWVVHVIDNDPTVSGALGYHDFSGVLPIGYVLQKVCAANGIALSSVLSHEILEMLGDPLINLGVQKGGSTWWAHEVGDPCEQSEYTVTFNVVGLTHSAQVSDYVLPSWFSTRGRAPFDKMGKITTPLTLEPGGSYIGQWTPTTGWTSKNAAGQEETEPDPTTIRRCLRPFQRREQEQGGIDV